MGLLLIWEKVDLMRILWRVVKVRWMELGIGLMMDWFLLLKISRVKYMIMAILIYYFIKKMISKLIMVDLQPIKTILLK